jgi:rhomboid-like protein
VYGRGSQFSFGPPLTPPIVKNLIIANVVVYVAQMATYNSPYGPGFVTGLGRVSPHEVWNYFELWRPFTYMWLHSPGSFLHIAFNMYALWLFGSALALAWGVQRFLRYYLVCGVGAGVLIATVPWIPYHLGFASTPEDVKALLAIPTLGASGAVMGVLLAYSFTWPERTIQLIFPPIPLKAIWLIPFLLLIEFTSGPSNVSHLGHLGGIAVGWIYLLREGQTPGLPTVKTLEHRWRRYKMRRRLRAVHDEDKQNRQDRQRRPRRDDDDHTLH